jgi:transcriptional regulator with XRE-family HTH domain
MKDAAIVHFGNFVRWDRIKRGWSLAEMASKVGLTEKRLWAIEKMPEPVSYGTTIASISQVLGYKPEEFDSIWRAASLPASAREKVPGQGCASCANAGIAPTIYLPVPEWRADIRASHWVEIPICGDDASDPKQVALRQLGRFRLVVVGDCMEPMFRDGDRVEFRVIEWGEETLIPGAPYAICKSDGLATFKLFDHDEEDALVFRAANPKYKDLLTVPVQEIGRIAIAEGIFSPVGAANSDDARIAALARENRSVARHRPTRDA